MTPPNQSAWIRRLRRLTWFFGAAGTFYLISTYTLDRMKEARMRALKDRREKDLLKNHFSTLLSTLSFTLYALLPTLSPQLDSAYPVELTSQALQGLSNPVSSQISTASGDNEADQVGSSSILDSSVPDVSTHYADSSEGDPRRLSSGSGGNGVEASVTESWASEFRGGGDAESVMTETDDGYQFSSTTSQPISLPPTDISTSSGSPPSDMMTSSHLHSPPPIPLHRDPSPPGLDILSGKSKKELWRDLKIQSITRAITTAYLLPLLYILTTSQLSTLARERYLSDVKASLPPIPASATAKVKDDFGISSVIVEAASLLPNPFAILPDFITSRIPFYPTQNRNLEEEEDEKELSRVLAQEREDEEAQNRADAERMYLTYSWWVLHEGWRVVADRVEAGVERVVGSMGLKRELSLSDWEDVLKDVRRYVEHDEESDRPFDFTPHLLPSYPLPPTDSACPLPTSPPSAHLQRLLSQTRTHLKSPDTTYLIQGGVSNMLRNLLASLSSEVYSSNPQDRFRSFGDDEVESEDFEGRKKRLAECLPGFSRWGKGVWEGVPDMGVENLLGMGEFEGFAGLIFGDWA